MSSGRSAGARDDRLILLAPTALPTFPISPIALAIGDGVRLGQCCDKPDGVLGTAAKRVEEIRCEAMWDCNWKIREQRLN